MNFGQLLGGLALLVVGGLAVAAIMEYLSYEKVLSWFQQRESLLKADCDRVGLLFLEQYNNGNYRTITGVFDTVTEEMITSEVMESRNVDSRIKEACRQDGYAVYTIES